MKAFAVAGLALMLCRPATALTCEEVRYYVETYGAATTLAYAKKMGATDDQIRQGRACLRRAARTDGRTFRGRVVVER